MQGYDLIYFIEYLVNNLNEYLTRCIGVHYVEPLFEKI